MTWHDIKTAPRDGTVIITKGQFRVDETGDTIRINFYDKEIFPEKGWQHCPPEPAYWAEI